MKDALLAFPCSPFRKGWPLALKFEPRHTETAGGLHEVDVEFEELPRSRPIAEQGRVLSELRFVAGVHHGGLAVDPENKRLFVERAEHQRHPAVFQHMRRGLVAAAGEIQPDDFPCIDHAQGVQTFRRDVDSAFRASGADKEQGLPPDEPDMFLG